MQRQSVQIMSRIQKVPDSFLMSLKLISSFTSGSSPSVPSARGTSIHFGRRITFKLAVLAVGVAVQVHEGDAAEKAENTEADAREQGDRELL